LRIYQLEGFYGNLNPTVIEKKYILKPSIEKKFSSFFFSCFASYLTKKEILELKNIKNLLKKKVFSQSNTKIFLNY
jgi:hypothetical protein